METAITLTRCPQCSGEHRQVVEPTAEQYTTLTTCDRCSVLGFRSLTIAARGLEFYR